ncbi:MAG TPA: ribonuclease P protein component [Bacteroidia bacterium]|nr:ribonuclease P protein component [Bacteroidia bacterium]
MSGDAVMISEAPGTLSPIPVKNTFRKSERLSGRKKFEELVKDGAQFFSHPFRVIWMETEEALPYPAQIAFAVSKRNFRHAVKRNKVKRILRESYRRHKHDFYEQLKMRDKRLRALLIYTPRELPVLTETDAKIILTLQRLIKASAAASR